jgi:exopolysaccharide biosynthesis WecB/TagA/CpsF family protein
VTEGETLMTLQDHGIVLPAPRSPVRATTPSPGRRIHVGGCPVDLMDRPEAVAAITRRWGHEHAPLGVVSLNLDHIHHFGEHGAWQGILEDRPGHGSVSWLHLLDGQPLVHRAEQLTGTRWPRLAGSDLIEELLDEAERLGARVGILGGSDETHHLLRRTFAETRPGLSISGWWAPARAELQDDRRSREIAAEVAAARTDLLVVGLGKPRQELWIAEYGALTGACTLLAFGAVVDFLAGRIPRAPGWMSEHTLEWAYRLAREPRRLSRRYLVQGPPAYVRIRRSGATVPLEWAPLPTERPVSGRGVCVTIVTYQSAATIGPLLADLAREAEHTDLRVVVKDNGSTDRTVDVVEGHAGVELVADRANLGYAGGINAALAHLRTRPDWDDLRTWDHLVLNPDVRLREGALVAMLDRLHRPGVGAVVPRLLDPAGRTSPSLRRDPSVNRTVTTALVGSRRAGRLSETVHDPTSYEHPHPVDWATGAVVLVRAAAAADVGEWDERFFLYSEETDYLVRLRAAGWRVWFEPAAVAEHTGQASGSSPRLEALMAVNRVRYAEKHLGTRSATVVRTATAVGCLLRARDAGHRAALRHLLTRVTWDSLTAGPPR